MATETLTCKEGHTWKRPTTRGRKPEYCPEHGPTKAKEPTDEPVDRTKALAKARAVKAENKQKAQTSIGRQVQAILDNDRISAELRRKLKYAHEHIRNPGMDEVRKNLIREATR